MTRIDLTLFYWLNRVVGESVLAAEVAYFVEEWAAPLCLGFLVWKFVHCRTDKGRVRLAIILAAVGAVLSIGAADIIASEFYRPRPFVALKDTFLLIPQMENSSFPCLAATWSAAVSAALFGLSEKSIAWYSLTLTVLIVVTRPILGDHWPSDMFASLVLGGVIGYFVSLLREPLEPLIPGFLRTLGRARNRLFP